MVVVVRQVCNLPFWYLGKKFLATMHSRMRRQVANKKIYGNTFQIRLSNTGIYNRDTIRGYYEKSANNWNNGSGRGLSC